MEPVNTYDFFDNIMVGNNNEAKEILDNLLTAKAYEMLDARKQQIAQSLFGEPETTDYEDQEEQE